MAVRVVSRSLLALVLPALWLTSLAGECIAPETPHEPTRAERGPLATKELNQRLKTWQQRLQLQQWKITVALARPDQLRARTLGNIHWDAEKMTATIKVLDSTEYHAPFQSALKDMEFTLVHELLHLELAYMPKTDDSRPIEEDAVNRMTTALLALDRTPDSEQTHDASIAMR